MRPRNRQVANDTAAKGDECHIAVDAQRQYVLEKPRQDGHALAGFARRNGKAVAAPCRRPARRLQRFQMMRCDGGVTDDNDVPAGKHAVRDVHDAVKQPAADSDVVAARTKADSQGLMMVHNNPELCFREMAVKGISTAFTAAAADRRSVFTVIWARP